MRSAARCSSDERAEAFAVTYRRCYPMATEEEAAAAEANAAEDRYYRYVECIDPYQPASLPRSLAL